jgi:adenine-specific DNA-methyltransferase
MYRRFLTDFAVSPKNNLWTDVLMTGFSEEKTYVVQTSSKVIQRCILMTTDPGDLVLDPTCGSGTTAYVSEQWGRRWITIDTSRVALALARARIMGARYPYYLLADSREGQIKEAEVTRTAPSSQPTRGNIRHGFVYERVPHITLKSIANNAEIDVIWEKWQATLDPLRMELSRAIGQDLQDEQDTSGGAQSHPVNPVHPVQGKVLEEWEIPRDADPAWPVEAKALHAEWWQARIARQREIDASIAAKAEFEYLYDRPYVDNRKVRVAGPFTVDSLFTDTRPQAAGVGLQGLLRSSMAFLWNYVATSAQPFAPAPLATDGQNAIPDQRMSLSTTAWRVHIAPTLLRPPRARRRIGRRPK